MKYIQEIKEMLEAEHRRTQRDAIVEYVGTDRTKMKALMNLFIDDKWHWRYNQRSAWPIGVIGRKYPAMMEPYHIDMVAILDTPTHDAQLRNIVRIYEDIDIPESIEGVLYDKCYGFLSNPQVPIAVRCFSMTVAAKVATKYPELQGELVAMIKEHLPHGSAGFKSRGGKIINRFAN